MTRIVPLYVDHLGWSSTHIWDSIKIFEDLGFVMIDPPPSQDVFHMSHFFMDHGRAYVELYALTKDGQMWSNWATGGKPCFDAKGQTGVFSFVLSTKDIDATRKAAIEAGFPCTTVLRGPRQNNMYPSIGGSPGKAIFQFEMDEVPFPNAFFACMEHTDAENAHYFRKNVHMYHKNGVTGISSAVLYYETEEELIKAQRRLNQLQDAIAPFAEIGYCTEYVRLIDKSAYNKEFGDVRPNIDSPVCAVEFENADLDYLREKAVEHRITHFERNGKLYIDTVLQLNTFLIFTNDK